MSAPLDGRTRGHSFRDGEPLQAPGSAVRPRCRTLPESMMGPTGVNGGRRSRKSRNAEVGELIKER